MLGDVVWQLLGQAKDIAKLLLNDLLEVDHSPSVELLESLSLRADADTARAKHRQAEVWWHLWCLVDVSTRLLDERLHVFFILEHKDVVSKVSSKLSLTLFNLTFAECDGIVGLPERPLTMQEELLILAETCRKKILECSGTLFEGLCNGAQRLVLVWLDSLNDAVTELVRVQTCNINFDVGAVIEFDNQLVKDVALLHVVELELLVEVSRVIAATHDHLTWKKRANETLSQKILLVHLLSSIRVDYGFWFFYDLISIFIVLLWLGCVAHLALVCRVGLAICRRDKDIART